MNKCCHRQAVCFEGSCGASRHYKGGWDPTWPPPVLHAIKDLPEAPPVLDPVQDLSEAPGRVLQPAALRRITDGCPICISLRLCVVPCALHGRTPNHVRHQPASKDTPVQVRCTWVTLQSCLALHLSPHLYSQHGSLTNVHYLQGCMPEHAEVEPWVLNPKVRTMRCSDLAQNSHRTRSTPLPACNMLPSIARSIHVSAPYTLGDFSHSSTVS